MIDDGTTCVSGLESSKEGFMVDRRPAGYKTVSGDRHGPVSSQKNPFIAEASA